MLVPCWVRFPLFSVNCVVVSGPCWNQLYIILGPLREKIGIALGSFLYYFRSSWDLFRNMFIYFSMRFISTVYQWYIIFIQTLYEFTIIFQSKKTEEFVRNQNDPMINESDHMMFGMPVGPRGVHQHDPGQLGGVASSQGLGCKTIMVWVERSDWWPHPLCVTLGALLTIIWHLTRMMYWPKCWANLGILCGS